MKRNRRSIRLKGYDYSRSGGYFITVCVRNRECLFGEIRDGEMRLNEWGRIVADEWMKTARIRNEIELDEWVIMPNHFHGIIIVRATVGATGRSPVHGAGGAGGAAGPKSKSIGAVMAGFKSAVTKRINMIRKTPGARIWQRNYWEHIIRGELELSRIREYIRNNPGKWESDRHYPT